MNLKQCDVCGKVIVGRKEFTDAADLTMYIRDTTGDIVKIEKDICDDCSVGWNEALTNFFKTIDAVPQEK